jgi:hypothetical protein
MAGVRFGKHPTLTIKSGAGTYQGRLLKAEERAVYFLLPRDLPMGEAQFIVEAEGGLSKPFPVRIEASCFGIQSLRRSGRVATLEGTGLGNAGKDLEVVFGGRSLHPKSVRAGENGVDSIQVQIPSNAAALGCHIPVYVRTKGYLSNFADLADLPGCRDDPWPVLNPVPKGTGSIVLERTTLSAQGRSWTADSIDGIFLSPSKRDSPIPLWFPLSTGQCRVESRLIEGVQPDPLRLLRIDGSSLNTISAGKSLAVGSRAVGADGSGVYKATLGGDFPTVRRPKPLFYEPGKTIALSAKDGPTGPFKLTVPFVDDLEAVAPAKGPIDRLQPLEIRWRSHQPHVAVAAFSQNYTALVEVLCSTDGSAGHFTIPAEMLNALPSTDRVAGALAGYVGVVAISEPVPFSAPNLRKGAASSLRIRLDETDFH